MGIAAPLPVLSDGLRSRVLAAAAVARTRRTQGRRVLGGVLAMFALLGCLPWSGLILRFARHSEPLETAQRAGATTAGLSAPPEPTATASFSRREMFIAAMDDDWRMVEAELQSRAEFTRRVQM